jgi:hypothetical protein
MTGRRRATYLPSMLVVYVFGAWVGIIALPFGFIVGYAVCAAVTS